MTTNMLRNTNAIEWALRVDLAAAHRLAVMHDLHEGISNHFTALVPGETPRFLAVAAGIHWSEVRASEMLVVGLDGVTIDGDGEMENTAYNIHLALHRARPDAMCLLHTHMPYASAIARLEDPHLLPIGQTEIGLANEIAYDEEYSGLARELSEGERLARVIGDKKILFMGNHGVMVVGDSIGEAYDRLYFLERACQSQLFAMWTNRPLKMIKPEVVEMTQRQFRNSPKYGGVSFSELHFRALKKILDRTEPEYAQ